MVRVCGLGYDQPTWVLGAETPRSPVPQTSSLPFSVFCCLSLSALRGFFLPVHHFFLFFTQLAFWAYVSWLYLFGSCELQHLMPTAQPLGIE